MEKELGDRTERISFNRRELRDDLYDSAGLKDRKNGMEWEESIVSEKRDIEEVEWVMSENITKFHETTIITPEGSE